MRWVVWAALAAGLPGSAVRLRAQDSTAIPLIRAVEFRRLNIFAPEEATGLLPRLANKLHFVTRPWVVRREVLLQPGQPWDSAAAQETARNLRSLGIFRGVSVDSVRTDSGLVARVVTADGWSTRPDFRFRSTGTELIYSVSVEERNLLGTATLAALRYRKDPDRSTVVASFRQSRLIGGRVGIGAEYQDRSDGSLLFGQISRPYFTLSDRVSWLLDGLTFEGRVLRFFDGSAAARDTLQRRFQVGHAAASWALRSGREGYVRVGVNGQIRRDDYADERRADTLRHTVTGAVGGSLSWRAARFLEAQGLEGFAREQDVDLSLLVTGRLMLTPEVFGYEEDGVVPSLSFRVGFGRPKGFVTLTADLLGRFTGAGLDSGSVHLGGTLFFQPIRRHLAVLHAATGWLERPAPGFEFDLGSGIGPRAFRAHAFTGDRAFLTSAEYRWTATEDFLKLAAIGVAVFGDYGGAWYAGTSRRTGWDLGLGLRIGPTRGTDIEVNRIDLVYRGRNDVEPGGWVLVVGKGFAFSTGGRLDF